jgi:hypothetical protein
MAKLVMSGKKHFKFGKDEYSKDHDYSRDAYRHGEEEERAYEARKLSERIERERKRKEAAEAKRPIVQIMQAPAPTPYIPVGYNPYAYGAPAPAAAPNPTPAAQKPVAAYNNRDLLPPYPAGHPLRDDRPYGIILVIIIIGWIATLEAFRRKYFLDAEGKPRKPTQQEGQQIELIRTGGSVVLGIFTFLFVQTFVDNNPGTGSSVVAGVVAIAVAAGGYYGSGQLVDIYSKVHSTPPQCLKFKPDQFKDDPDYMQYEEATIKVCTQGKEKEKRKTTWQNIRDSAAYYLPFWGYMLMYMLGVVFIGGLVYGQGTKNLVSDNSPLVTGVILAVMVMAMIIVPIGGYEVPYFVGEQPKKEDSETKRAEALSRLTEKLTTKCEPECTAMCQATLETLLKYASRACN